MSDSDNPVIAVPTTIKSRTDQADFRRLSDEGREKVWSGEPLNRVAIAEGVRVRLTPLEQAQKAFRKLCREDRDAFDLWRAEQAL